MKKKISYILPAIIAVAILGVGGCKGKIEPGTVEPKRPEVKGVTLEEVRTGIYDEYYEASGSVVPKTVSVVSARTMGTVVALYVKDGDIVRKGQSLLLIDDRDARQRVRQAEEAFEEAQRALASARKQKELADITYERYKKLYDEHALSRQELDQMETQKNVAGFELERMEAMVKRTAAALDEARVYLGFTKVTAPIDGVVADKKIDLGSMAAPGMPLMTVQDNSAFRLEVAVDERLSGMLKKGMNADVIIESAGRAVSGKIAEINPAIDPITRTFIVKIDIKDSLLRGGMFGRVRFPIGKKEIITVPKSALVKRGQIEGVFTVGADSVVAYRIVRTGKEYGERIEILSGIASGDKVIVNGVASAVDGGLYKGDSK